MPSVKNRAAAPIQISAEQILREARDRVIDVAKAPRQQITDAEELRVFRQRKRKEFEDAIRMQRDLIGVWLNYAKWEESQSEYDRARSVFERLLGVDYQNNKIWQKYAEMEMRGKFVNHARNVWDRAVQLLPRQDQLWYKYTYMEEMMGDTDKARKVFERWMDWEPDDNAWTAFMKFEMRMGEPSRSREVLKRYVVCHPHSRAYLKWARWEEKQGQLALARGVYERALSELDAADRSERLFIEFAKLEERCKETERARVIFKYALDEIGKDEGAQVQSSALYREFMSFEKKHGSMEGIESAVVNKKRMQYEDEVAKDPHNYDTWFDFIRLEESQGNIEAIREVYERAIANVPPVQEKRFWRRYIYLWINYALYEELEAEDVERARQVYKACLGVLPAKSFTFAKVWLMLAMLEVRQKDLTAARKVLGEAIGRNSGKEKLYKGYIALELQLGDVDRCRSIYAKYLEAMPHNCSAWTKFAQLETKVGETDRARAVYELAISQPVLDMPEVLWKGYIDMEIQEAADGNSEGTDNARALYKRLLDKAQHVKVWISFAQFELANGGGLAACRSAFQEGYDSLKKQEFKEERVVLLEAWRDAEKEAGDAEGKAAVEAKMPRKLKKRRMVSGEAGEELGWEEYYDYRFPDDEQAPANLKLLEMAQKWKEQEKGTKRKADAMGDA
ncbi:unnamed protein product [Chrysoparadoxa australica]